MRVGCFTARTAIGSPYRSHPPQTEGRVPTDLAPSRSPVVARRSVVPAADRQFGAAILPTEIHLRLQSNSWRSVALAVQHPGNAECPAPHPMPVQRLIQLE